MPDPTPRRPASTESTGRGKRLFLIIVGSLCGVTLLLCGGCAIRLWQLSAPNQPITIGPETTIIDGPLTVDGYIDYESALNRRFAEDVTTDNNSVVLLIQAYGPRDIAPSLRQRYFQLLGIAPVPESGDYLVNAGDFVKQQDPDTNTLGARIQQIFDDQSAAAKAPWTADDYPQLAALLDANAAPLELIVEASQRPRFYSPLISDPETPTLIASLLPLQQQQREAARQLTARAMLKLGAGDPQGAWDDLLACHRLSRLTGQSPFLIGALVSIAIDAVASNTGEALLASDALTADQARQCLADLDALPPLPSMTRIVDEDERFVFLDSVQLLARGRTQVLSDLASVDLGGSDGGRSMLNVATDWNVVLEAANDQYDEFAAALRLPDRSARVAEFQRIDAQLDAARSNNPLGAIAANTLFGDRDESSRQMAIVLLALLNPAVETAGTAGDRGEARRQLMRLGFALAVHQREHGSYPEALDELAPTILPTLPADPFTGQSFIYHRTDNGYRLYSVGANGTDDNGITFDDQPPGDDILLKIDGP